MRVPLSPSSPFPPAWNRVANDRSVPSLHSMRQRFDLFDREIVTPLGSTLFTPAVRVIGSKVIDIAGLKHDPARGVPIETDYPFCYRKKKLRPGAGPWQQQSSKTIQVAFFETGGRVTLARLFPPPSPLNRKQPCVAQQWIDVRPSANEPNVFLFIGFETCPPRRKGEPAFNFRSRQNDKGARREQKRRNKRRRDAKEQPIERDAERSVGSDAWKPFSSWAVKIGISFLSDRRVAHSVTGESTRGAERERDTR